MTELDHRETLAGYYPSAWPAECGGPRRQKVAGSRGLDLRPGEHLGSTIRETGGWAVMFVQRDPGELYLQCGAALGAGESPPVERREGDNTGWIERIDPITLETLARSPDLPSGGWLWCGAVVVHANGDLYTVNGRFAHRLDAECNVVAERELPVDAPHNGLIVMADGNLLTRNLGFRRGDRATFVVLEPESLSVVGEPFEIDARCMGRFSADRSAGGELVYTTTPTDVLRIRYSDGRLELDSSWRGSYAVAGERQSDAWDTTIADDNVWLMDMGRPPGWMRPGSAAQRAFRLSVADPSDTDVFEAFDQPFGWNPGPPLYDPIRKVLVHYDSVNGGVVAHRVSAGVSPELLWRSDARNFVQMMVYADTGELVIEDSSLPPAFGGDRDEAGLVVLDVETGREKSRADIGGATLGMFLCPGFGRDLYVASLGGTVTRVHVT